MRSSAGTPYVALRPLLADFTLSMTRGAAVIYPKDAAQILAMADIWPGARVLEAGAGSGALSCWLLRAVGPDGLLVSYERRTDFAGHRAQERRAVLRRPAAVLGVAGRRVRPGSGPGGEERGHGGRSEGTADEPFDRVVLDMLAPWECVGAAARVLLPGGVLACYVATVTQLSATLRQFAGMGVSMSLPRGNPSLAAGTPTVSRYVPSTGWWATPASWSPHGGSPRESSHLRGGGGPPRGRMTHGRPGDLRRCRRKGERNVQRGRVV